MKQPSKFNKDEKPWRNNKHFVEESKRKNFVDELQKDVKKSHEAAKLLRERAKDYE